MRTDKAWRSTYGEAAKWYRKAAEQGCHLAQLHFGLMCLKGQGVSQDYVQAHKWLNLACSCLPASDTENVNLAVTRRDQVAAKMAPAQLTEAQRLASEWQAKHQ